MDRTTRISKNNDYFVDAGKVEHVDSGYSGEAISQLAKFENFYEDLICKQGEIAIEMEKLRAEGKSNSVKFKQLLANKLSNNNILILLKYHGLE